MKKVLISAYNLDFGGIETSLINLLKNMDLNKYEVTLVLERKEGVFLNQVPKRIKVKEYKVSNNKNILIRKSINLLKKIKWIIFNYKKYSSSICYATYSKPGSFLARTSSNNKIIFVHNDYYQSFKNDINKTKEFFNGINLEKYNHIVFVSNESRIKIEKLFPKNKNNMITINNLIDHNRIIKLANEEKIIKDKNKKVFLFVGRLDEDQKRISRIIKLAKRKHDNKEIEFWIVGDGPDKEQYINEIKKEKLNNIKLLGSKKNPYPYIKACDALIMTSDYEGFPVVYNEAIILKKPILTTIDVTDDFININERFGYVSSTKIDELDEKTSEIIKNFKIKENVDFGKLNKKRVKMIENLLENEND